MGESARFGSFSRDGMFSVEACIRSWKEQVCHNKGKTPADRPNGSPQVKQNGTTFTTGVYTYIGVLYALLNASVYAGSRIAF
jgi:hypothetical protein